MTEVLKPEMVAAAIAGYLSTPLVSLAVRGHWSKRIKFCVAAAIAAVASAVAAIVLGDLQSFGQLVPGVFAVQQVTWALHVPGAGTTAVNESLERIGTPAEVYEEDVDELTGEEVAPITEE